MTENRAAVAVCGFQLRIAPFAGAPYRVHGVENALVVEVQRPDGWRSATINTITGGGLGGAASVLASVAHVEAGPSWNAWRVETSSFRIPLPASWMLHWSGDRSASPLFELLGPDGASISVRTSRRMPALESFQGPGHVFRDIGQLERAGFIEFEHADAGRTWLYRHEQLHRGTTPFVVTLKTPVDLASTHIATLASVVEQLELPEEIPEGG